MPDTDTDRTEPDSLARSPQAAMWRGPNQGVDKSKIFEVIKSAQFAGDAHLVICAKML